MPASRWQTNLNDLLQWTLRCVNGVDISMVEELDGDGRTVDDG